MNDIIPDLEKVIELLEKSKHSHKYIEDDPWYSCPKAPEGCADKSQGNECNCGADKKNKNIDKAINILEWIEDGMI